MWVADQYYSILGTPMMVRFEFEEPMEGVAELLGSFAVAERIPVRQRHRFSLVTGAHKGEQHAGHVLVYRDCSRIARATNLRSAVGHMMAAMNRTAIESCEPFAVHAGVVARGGSGIAIPVDSMGGKSTLTAALVLGGFEYVSDEALCLESDGSVVPYRKPLGLSPWSIDALGLEEVAVPFPKGEGSGEVLVPHGLLGGSPPQEPVTLAHLVLPEFGHDEASLEQVAASDGMATLLAMSFNHYRHGADAFHLAAAVANQATAWRLRYGDPLAAAKLIGERLG
ncbi:MAG: hypothetical protein WD990_01770 [Acidimicrobiia bacterium]